MSPSPEHEPIDRLIERCLAQRAPSNEHIEALTKKIQQELLRQPEVKQPPPVHRTSKAWVGAAAIAASFFIGVVLWKWFSPASLDSQAGQSLTVASVSESIVAGSSMSAANQQLDRRKALFVEMQRVFDQQVAWIAESPSDLQFEVDSNLVGEQKPLLCIRLTLSEPANAASEARTLWEMEVIVRSEQTVRIGDDPTAPELVLWPFMTEDGKVFVDTQINLSEPFGLTNNQSRLLNLGVHDQQQLNANFVLSQSVELLSAPGI